MSENKLQPQFQAKGRVKVVQGSILTPHNAGLRFILNIANLAGKPESPLYALFDRKWSKVKQEVRGWYATKTGAYKVGVVHTLAVQSDVWILTLLCQDEELKTDVNALKKCLAEVCKMAKYENSTVHVSTLLTQEIEELPNLLISELVDKGVSVSYYEEPTE